MLYKSKIRVAGSFRKLIHSLNERSYTLFMRQIEFHLDIQRKCIFAPINGQQHELFIDMICATSKGSEKPAHMYSLTRAFASYLTII